MDNKTSIVNRFSATQVELAKYVKIEPIEFEDRKGWTVYGEQNAFPQYLIELYNNSPVHGALVNSIAFMIAGKEFTASTTLALREVQRLKLDKVLKSTALDLKLQGGFYWEVIWSMDRSTIAQINHLPFENCRLACTDDNDDINGVWYSRDWADTRKKKNTPHFIPFFDINTKDDNPKQVLFQHSMMIGSEYYPKPDYIGAVNEVEKLRQYSEYQVNLILNGFFPSLIASFNNGIPTLEEQRMIKQQLQMSIQGAENAGKVLTFFNEEKDRGVEFTNFPVSDLDKQFESLVTPAIEQILVSHRVTSPLLFGVRDGGGLGSNTDEMKTAFRLFSKQVIDPFQRIICDGVDILLQAIGVPSDVSIVSNNLFEEQVAIDSNGTPAPTQDLSSQALNGAQISSLLEIITQTTANVLTVTSAKAITKASFPTLTDGQISDIFDNLSSVNLQPTDVIQSSEKKKVEPKHSDVSKVCCSSEADFTDEEGKGFLKQLAECGELIDLNEWELVEEEEVVDYDNEEKLSKVHQALDGYADPDAKSKLDAGVYKVRYRYSTWIGENSREFCREMVRLSKGGIVWRYEDIIDMGDAGVNGQFARQGANSYNLFRYCGGVNCHHFWMRAIYKRKKEKGRYLPNEGMDNEMKIAVRKAEKEGFSPKDLAVGYNDAKTPMIKRPNGGRLTK